MPTQEQGQKRDINRTLDDIDQDISQAKMPFSERIMRAAVRLIP